MKKLTDQNIIEILNKQFEIAGYGVTAEEMLLKYGTVVEFLKHYETTQEKEDEFRDWLKVYLKKYSFKGRIERDIDWLILRYGLSIKQ